MSSTSTVRRTRIYSAACYLTFVVGLVWCIAFLANLDGVPSIDRRPAPSAWRAVLVDSGLLLVFALPHSVLARAGVKKRLERLVRPPVERSTYVLIASLSLGLLFWQWQPILAEVWRIDSDAAATVVWAVYGLGWAIVVASTFMSDHLEFLGLRQGGWATRRQQEGGLSERWLFAWVRHPLMLGLLIACWATPAMSAGHLLFAAGASGYIVVGVHFEERDLRRRFGTTYDEYADRVPGIVPRPRRAAAVR
jgi:protein-S-isoprenylcysteine O-methyltransferase Ste14